MNSTNIKAKFTELFSHKPTLYRSPGRINLIGEHTDYNEGFVMPAAIDKEMLAAIAPNREKRICRLFAFDLNESFEFDLEEMAPVEQGWPNYVMGVADQINKSGRSLEGFDCVVGGDIPLGAGLSSSAAFECVIAYGLNDLFRLEIPKLDQVKMAQLAEHKYAGVNCGIMDQFASMMGKKDAAFRLDCKTLEYNYFPLDLKEYQILLINTNVKHSLASTEYNTRRLECEHGVEILKKQYPGINSLRDVSREMLNETKKDFDPITHKRCKFVVEENERVLLAGKALEAGDLNTFGQLVYGSHGGLSKEYEVSCPELDYLVDQTRNKDFILGARMMGGGFGGCSLNIIEKRALPEFLAELGPKYFTKFGKEMTPIEVSIEGGTSCVEIN